MLEVGEEARGFIALNFAVLDWKAVEIYLDISRRVSRKIQGSARTIVEFDRLVGGRACLILGSFLAQPKMEVVGKNIRIRAFLISVQTNI